MKFENEYIKIKTKRREVTLHNYIYDRYLALFSQSQYETDIIKLENINNNKQLYCCYIKFEEEISDVTNATKSDFDISLEQTTANTVGNNNSVSTLYVYSVKENEVFDLKEQGYKDISNYENKKITALAFGNNYIMSCVDTSNYDVRIIKDENFAIARKDIMTTDGECDGIDYPLHLASTSNIYQMLESEATNVPVWAKLYSIGFGTTKGNISEEYIIGEDIEVIKEDEKTFGFNLLKGFQQSIYPVNDIYPSDELYPMPMYIQEEKYLSQDIYPSDDMYPMQSNYKYIIYKFKLYYIDTMQDRLIELDKYYTLSYQDMQTKGLFEIKTKIERRK